MTLQPTVNSISTTLLASLRPTRIRHNDEMAMDGPAYCRWPGRSGVGRAIGTIRGWLSSGGISRSGHLRQLRPALPAVPSIPAWGSGSGESLRPVRLRHRCPLRSRVSEFADSCNEQIDAHHSRQ
jgi:hypothetical protein